MAKRTDAFRNLMDQINKKYKGDYARPASNRVAFSVPKIPTGVLAIDVATYGGFPVGRVSVIWGEFSTAKTTIVLKLIGQAQRTCRGCFSRMQVKSVEAVYINDQDNEIKLKSDLKKPGPEWRLAKLKNLKCPKCGGTEAFRCLLMDVEGVFETKWALAMGVDPEQLYVVQTEYAEQAIDIADAALRSQECDLLVVDSIAAMTPSKEIEDSMEKMQQGLAARLVNKAVRKWVSTQTAEGAESGRRPTVVLLNQVRQKIGVVYGSPDVMPGGKGQTFASSMTLRTRGGGKHQFDENGKTLSCEITVVVQKSKVSPPREEGSFVLHLREHDGFATGDTQEAKVVMSTALKYGLIVKNKNKYEIRTHPNQKAFTSQKEITAWLQTDDEALYKLRNAILGVFGGGTNATKANA